MTQKMYDVVIIGSGLGGLAAATLLVRKGFRTLVLEGRGRLGGRFSTIEQEGFKLPTGAVLIPEGWVTRLMKEMGLDTTGLRPVSRMFYRIDGRQYEIPPEGGLPMLLDKLDALEKEAAERTGRSPDAVRADRILEGYLEGIGGARHEGITTVRDWLSQFTENERAHEVFDNLCASLLMARSWELPVSSLFRFGIMDKFYIAPRGNLSVAKELSRVVEENGTVWADSPAKRIVVDGERARGVVVEKDGKELEIPCKTVVSNVGPRRTVELAGPKDFDDDYMRDMRVKLRPSPSMLILVASDRPLCLEGVQDGMEVILGGRRIANVVPISNVCPELAPPGQHLLYTSVEPLCSVRPMDRKVELQQSILDLKEMFPDFEEHGRILRVIPCDVNNDWPEGRTWVGYGLPLETTISNLFNVGDACLAPELTGTSGAVESGYRVADAVEGTL